MTHLKHIGRLHKLQSFLSGIILADNKSGQTILYSSDPRKTDVCVFTVCKDDPNFFIIETKNIDDTGSRYFRNTTTKKTRYPIKLFDKLVAMKKSQGYTEENPFGMGEFVWNSKELENFEEKAGAEVQDFKAKYSEAEKKDKEKYKDQFGNTPDQ